MFDHWNEIRQRRMNVSRQLTEISSLNDDIIRIKKEIDHELSKRVVTRSPTRVNSKECFYCAETISEKAKVCPKCRRVFLESALEVFQMEKYIFEEIDNETL